MQPSHWANVGHNIVAGGYAPPSTSLVMCELTYAYSMTNCHHHYVTGFGRDPLWSWFLTHTKHHHPFQCCLHWHQGLEPHTPFHVVADHPRPSSPGLSTSTYQPENRGTLTSPSSAHIPHQCAQAPSHSSQPLVHTGSSTMITNFRGWHHNTGLSGQYLRHIMVPTCHMLPFPTSLPSHPICRSTNCFFFLSTLLVCHCFPYPWCEK